MIDDFEERKSTMTAIKTKRAQIDFGFNTKERVTCYDYGDKDPWGKTIWYDAEGRAYDLRYARLARVWAFIRVSADDREDRKLQ